MAMAVSVLLVLALMAWPALISRSTAPRIAATAFDMAATLRTARATAGRDGRPVQVKVDLNQRVIQPERGTPVRLAQDLDIDFVTDRRCRVARGVFVLTFLPNGRSCGGVFTAARGRSGWRVEINWMTGAVDVVKARPS